MNYQYAKISNELRRKWTAEMIQKTFGREATAEELSSLGLWCWEAAFVQGFELAYGKAKERLMAAVGDL